MGSCLSSSAGGTGNFVEKVVCQEDELKVGELKEVELEDKSLCVVVKDEKGQIQALSGKCPHYGASLAKGSYANGIIRCPWHGACFNAASGDIEDFPGLDSLYKYQVEVEGGEVKVKVDRSQLGKTKRTKKLVDKDPECKEVIVIVGGGAAAQVCYEL